MHRNNWLQRLGSPSCPLLPASTLKKTGGDTLLRILSTYQQCEDLDAQSLQEQQGVMLMRLLQHAAKHSAHFAKRLRQADWAPGETFDAAAFSRLPLLTRQDLIREGTAMDCSKVPAEHGKIYQTSTSGSTGEPVTLRKTALCAQHWRAHVIREQLWHQRSTTTKLAVVRANGEKFMHLPNRGTPFSLIAHSGPTELQPPGTSIADLIAWLSRFEAAEFLVLPSVLRGILVEVKSRNLKLPALESIRTLSETVSPDLRAQTREQLGINLIDSYSSQEGGIIAAECPEHQRYHATETIYLEVLNNTGQPCLAGETGKIVITDLLNFATPMIRYEIGDLATVAERCPCGRNSLALERILGRERNLLTMPNGDQHWPITGFHRWGEVAQIRQFQFIQETREKILVHLVTDAPLTTDQESRMAAIIRESLGGDFDIEFRQSRQLLPRSKGGKFEEFISRLSST